MDWGPIDLRERGVLTWALLLLEAGAICRQPNAVMGVYDCESSRPDKPAKNENLERHRRENLVAQLKYIFIPSTTSYLYFGGAVFFCFVDVLFLFTYTI